MQTIVFNGIIPREGPVELAKGYGVEAVNMYISTERYLHPLRDAAEITDTIFDIYGNTFTSDIVTLIRKGSVWIAWDHYVNVIRDIRKWDSINSFLFVENGKVYRSSDKWVLNKIHPKEIGIDPPRKPLIVQKDASNIVPAGDCPPFCPDGAVQGDARVYTFTYVNDMGEESQAFAYTDPVIIMPGEEGKYKLVDPNTPPPNAVKRNFYRSISTNTQAADNTDEATIFVYVGTNDIGDDFIDKAEPLDLGYELSTTLQRRIPHDVKGAAYIGDNRTVYWTNSNKLYISYPRLPHTIDERLKQEFPAPIIGAYSVVNTREGEHTYDLYVFTEECPYLVSEITSPSNERIMSVNQISINAVPLNPRAVCDIDGNLVYASSRGLISIVNGLPKDISGNFFSKEEWRVLGKDIELAYHEEELLIITPLKRYVMSFSAVYQDKLPSLSTTTITAKHAFGIMGEGLIVTNGNRYFRWNDADHYLTSVWTSARFRTRELWRPNIIKVDAGAPLEYDKHVEDIVILYKKLLEHNKISNVCEFLELYPAYDKYREYLVYINNPIVVKLYREGRLVFEERYIKGSYLRVPRLHRGIYWQVSIMTRYPVYRIMLEKSMIELSDTQQKNEDI